VGKYRAAGETQGGYTITRRGGQLACTFYGSGPGLDLVPHSERHFSLRYTAGDLDFDLLPDGTVKGLTFQMGGDTRSVVKVE
jgi:hypothetical protein